MNKAIFLDRDGTIIKDMIYLNDPEKIEYLPHSIEGLKKMSDLGYQLIVVTNQSGIPRGLVQLENLKTIHKKIRAHLASKGILIKQFYYAPFLVESGHKNRKPSPGMLLEAAQDFNIDFKNSWMIGDRFTDIQAGHAVGTSTIFIHGTEDANENTHIQYYKVNHLVEAADIIENNSKENL